MSIARLASSREMLLDDRCTGDFLIQIDQVSVKPGNWQANDAHTIDACQFPGTLSLTANLWDEVGIGGGPSRMGRVGWNVLLVLLVGRQTVEVQGFNVSIKERIVTRLTQMRRAHGGCVQAIGACGATIVQSVNVGDHP